MMKRMLCLCCIVWMMAFGAAGAETPERLVIFNMDSEDPWRFQRAADMFHEKYPDMELAASWVFDARLISNAMMSKTGEVDLLVTTDLFLPMPSYQYFASGAVLDLTQYPQITQYLPEYLDIFAACTLEGKLFAIPERVYPYAFQLNTGLAQKMGVEIPKPGWTWSDLAAIGRQVTAYNEANGTSYKLIADFAANPYILRQMNLNAADVAAGRASYVNEPMAQALAAWMEIVDSGLVLDENHGRADMMLNALFTVSNGLAYGSMGKRHCLVPPVFDENTRFPVSLNGVMVNANSRHREEALYFLQCFFAPETIEATPIQMLGPWFPDESRQYHQPGWSAMTQNNREVWLHLLERGIQDTRIGSMTGDQISELYPQLLAGEISVPEFLMSCQHRANLMLGE